MTIQKNNVFIFVCFILMNFITIPTQLRAQKEVDVDFDKIEDKHVSRAIKERGLVTLPQLHDLRPTASIIEDSSYYDHIKTYKASQNLEATWNTYTQLNIKDAWNGKKILRYGFVYDTENTEILYPEQDNQNIAIGRKVFFNVHLLGFVNLVTALEVLDINEEEHSITFSYVEGGNTIGTQKIVLEASGTTTLIKHITNYRSVKPWKLRDKHLYPFFHTKSIDEIHQNALGDKLTD